MKIYNLLGYLILASYALLSAFMAPPWLGPWLGLAAGLGYLLFVWFVAGVYLSNVIHMGITHRTLDYKDGFVKAVTLLNNTLGIYIDPVSWVNRHRLHHEFSDHPGDPNKLDADGFWKTLYRCLFPYPCQADVADDAILKTWPFRLVSHPLFTAASVIFSFGPLWLLMRDWRYALGLWLGARIFALWVNMIQNYWTHDRRWGTRRYDDPEDNAMNIGDWLPVTATFSACWQNNHHHYAHLLRTTHAPGEYDFGFMTVKVLAALGLVKPSKTGRDRPAGLPLAEISL